MVGVQKCEWNRWLTRGIGSMDCSFYVFHPCVSCAYSYIGEFYWIYKVYLDLKSQLDLPNVVSMRESRPVSGKQGNLQLKCHTVTTYPHEIQVNGIHCHISQWPIIHIGPPSLLKTND